MRRTILLLSLLTAFACQSEPAAEESQPAPAEETPAPAAPPANRGVAEATIGGAHISINYGRPELQGRDMLGQLQEGQVWRLGMNEATRLETAAPLQLGEVRLEAGRYSLWARRGAGEAWSLIINSEADIWGTQRKPENDVAEVPAQVTTLGDSVEKFTIEIHPTGDNNGEIVMKWATLQLTVPFQVVAQQ